MNLMNQDEYYDIKGYTWSTNCQIEDSSRSFLNLAFYNLLRAVSNEVGKPIDLIIERKAYDCNGGLLSHMVAILVLDKNMKRYDAIFRRTEDESIFMGMGVNGDRSFETNKVEIEKRLRKRLEEID